MPEKRIPSGLGNVALHDSEPVAASTIPVRLEMRPLWGYSVPFFIINVTSGKAAKYLSMSACELPPLTASICRLPLTMVIKVMGDTWSPARTLIWPTTPDTGAVMVQKPRLTRALLVAA